MEDVQKEGGQDPNDNLDEKELQETSEDDIRSQIIDDYELDEEEQSPLIDKLVQEKTEDQKKLSTAIKQKRSWREKFEAKPAPTEQKKEEKPQPPQKVSDESLEEKLDSRIKSRFEEEKLNSLDLSDDLKKEVKNYAKLNDVSIKEAETSSYIQFIKKEEEDKERNDKASIGGAHKAGKANLDFSEMKPDDFDLSEKEGREEFAKWKKWLKTQ